MLSYVSLDINPVPRLSTLLTVDQRPTETSKIYKPGRVGKAQFHTMARQPFEKTCTLIFVMHFSEALELQTLFSYVEKSIA